MEDLLNLNDLLNNTRFSVKVDKTVAQFSTNAYFTRPELSYPNYSFLSSTAVMPYFKFKLLFKVLSEQKKVVDVYFKVVSINFESTRFGMFLDYEISANCKTAGSILKSEKKSFQHLEFGNFYSFFLCHLDMRNVMSAAYLDFEIDFSFDCVHFFPASSTLAYSLHLNSSKTPYFRFLNTKSISDAPFKLKNQGKIIWTSKEILCTECPFFKNMFDEEWAENSKEDGVLKPIEIPGWSDEVLLACILHIYLGWLPGTGISKEVLTKLDLNKSDFNFDFFKWKELHDIGQMLERKVLAFYALKMWKEDFSKIVSELEKDFTNVSSLEK